MRGDDGGDGAGAPAEALKPGTALITPLDERSEPLQASLLSMDVGEGGMSVVAKAKVPRTVHIGTQRVWVMAKHEGKVTSFQGLAQQTQPAVVELTGLTTPLEEHRRAFPRTSVDLHCHMRPSRGEGMRSWTMGRVVDLSRHSCRVRTPGGQVPPTGTHMEIVMDLDGRPFPAFAAVTRAEPGSGEAVLTFLSVSRKDTVRVDRFVLSRVAPGE